MISAKLSPLQELKLKTMEVKKNLLDVESLLRRQRKKEAENEAQKEEEKAITEFIEEFFPASAPSCDEEFEDVYCLQEKFLQEGEGFECLCVYCLEKKTIKK